MEDSKIRWFFTQTPIGPVLVLVAIILALGVFYVKYINPMPVRTRAKAFVGRYYDVKVLAKAAENIGEAKNDKNFPQIEEVIRTFGWATYVPDKTSELPCATSYELRPTDPRNTFILEEKYGKKVPKIFVRVLNGELDLSVPVQPQGVWCRNEKGGVYLLVINQRPL